MSAFQTQFKNTLDNIFSIGVVIDTVQIIAPVIPKRAPGEKPKSVEWGGQLTFTVRDSTECAIMRTEHLCTRRTKTDLRRDRCESL